MPHGPLTPLGRQLRSVVANSYFHLRANATSTRHSSTHRRDGRSLHQSALKEGQVAAAVYNAAPDHVAYAPQIISDGRQFREHGWRRLKRRRRVDHLGDSLRDVGKHAAASKVVNGKLDYSHVSPRSRKPRIDLERRQQRFKDHVAPDSSKELSLQRILASYVRHQSKATDYLEAEWETPFTLSERESAFLEFKGYDLESVASWAAIVTSEDAVAAAELLSQRTASLGPESVPTFVYLNLLRRGYIPAQALRTFIRCNFDLFHHRAGRLEYPGVDNQPVFIVVIRLLRHAREVWPQAMQAVVKFMLSHLQCQETKHGAFNSKQRSSISFMLNKLMGLVSYSTAENPFKDNPYQEAAIVSILAYMAEHKPAMQIDRQGYRAVIRTQLAQRKSPDDQQWAELKALSWPPWKHDRTAMDASIDLKYGISRAQNTLIRMREAGYSMLNWEKAAHLYTGWDVDRTPTIQMRALFQPPGAQFASMVSRDNFTPWAARVASTRTIQEAWACYLAWESAGLPHDQNVYLEIFRKLHEEEKRQKALASSTGGLAIAESKATPMYKWRKVWNLLPGDTREVSPLPPSTHLYTYTRTLPPRLDDFYATLIGRGVVFQDYCLLYLVNSANSLISGLQRLLHSSQKYPEIERLIAFDSTRDLTRLPLPVFRAAIELYTRFSRARMPNEFKCTTFPQRAQSSRDRINWNHPMGRAIELLRAHPVPYRPLWNAVNNALNGAAAIGHNNLVTLYRFGKHSQSLRRRCNEDNPELVGFTNASKAHHTVLQLLRQNHVHLDSSGLRTLCNQAASTFTTAWAIVLTHLRHMQDSPTQQGHASPDLYERAVSIIQSNDDSARLVEEFRRSIGMDGGAVPFMPRSMLASSTTGLPVDKLPRLLIIPSPAVLHAYIRALGWAADYERLSEALQWMRDHESELVERRAHHRLGEDMMRKAIVALRVYLERSWIENAADDLPEQLDKDVRLVLERLRKPAVPALIEAARRIVDSVEGWDGWATDEEVEQYISDKRFDPFR